jgi:tetratricopeptide (TPR) repeat protein
VLSEDFAGLWQRVELRIGQEAKIFAEESREAPARAAELLALPPRGRNRKLDAEPRFHSTALALELIARARGELGRRRAERALPPLKAALRILRQRSLHSAAGRRELQAEAFCELGEAWRRLGSSHWAESCFRQAAQALRDSPDAMARALFCGRLARLRAGERRLDEAVALFGRAAALWAEVGDGEQSAAAAAEQAAARRQLGEPAELPEGRAPGDRRRPSERVRRRR